MKITSISNVYNKSYKAVTKTKTKKTETSTIRNDAYKYAQNVSFGIKLNINIPFKLPDFTLSQRKKQLKALDVSDYNIEKFSKYSDERYKRVIKLLSESINEECIDKLSNLDDEQYKKAEDLSSKGIDGESIERFIDLDEIGYKKGIKFIQEGYSPTIASYLASLSDEQTKMALDFLNQNISISSSVKLAQFDESKREKCFSLYKKGLSMTESISLADLPDDKAKNIDELIKLNMGDENVTDFAQLDETTYKKAIELFKAGVLPEFIIDIIDIENEPDKNKEYQENREKGYSRSASFALSILSDEEKDAFDILIRKNPNIKQLLKTDCDITIINRQNDNKTEAILCREKRCEDGTLITLTYTFDKDGNSTASRTEEYSNKATSSRMNKKAGVFNLKYDKYGQIREMTQIIEHPETKNVIGVIHSKLSDKLKGAFEAVYYDIDDFETSISNDNNEIEFDIDKSVKTKGIPISTVTQDNNGLTTYKEHFKSNDCITDRLYKEKKDENGNILYSFYSYKIQDEQGKMLLDTQREFKRNQDGSVTNTINGITYTIKYNDDNRTITISDGKNQELLQTEGVFAPYSKDILWKTIKNIPADSLIIIASNIEKWHFVSNEYSLADGYNNILCSGDNISVINHETGHFKDYESKPISRNKKLLKIYTEEMNEFLNKIPYNEQEFIQYLSPRADLNDASGFGEFIAETNMLISSYGSDNENTKNRGQLLVRYFPKSIAMAAELLGKTSRKSIL